MDPKSMMWDQKWIKSLSCGIFFLVVSRSFHTRRPYQPSTAHEKATDSWASEHTTIRTTKISKEAVS